jgi:hypothetical protein
MHERSNPRLAVVVAALACAAGGAGCESVSPYHYTTGGEDVPAEAGKTYRFDFDDATNGGLPDDFILVLGEWKVAAEASAPSQPNVVRQSKAYSGPDFPRVVLRDLAFTDLTLRVRCRPESGDDDQACGLMFRFQDSDNYFLTRANALEGNVRLYRVVDGDREETASADLPVSAGEWHTLEATARGRSLGVSWDGEQVIAHEDDTFERGKVGLWTKADSVTAFDDLEATAE